MDSEYDLLTNYIEHQTKYQDKTLKVMSKATTKKLNYERRFNARAFGVNADTRGTGLVKFLQEHKRKPTAATSMKRIAF